MFQPDAESADPKSEGVVGRRHSLPFQFANECSRNADINGGSEAEEQMQEEQKGKEGRKNIHPELPSDLKS